MKKNLAIILVFIVSACLHAQEKMVLCGKDYTYAFEKCSDEVSNAEKFATIHWDFSDAPTGTTFSVEVVPIRDCWNELSAERFRETILIRIDGTDLKKKDSKILYHKLMMAKCFKWRFRADSPNCDEASAWRYYSFINAK